MQMMIFTIWNPTAAWCLPLAKELKLVRLKTGGELLLRQAFLKSQRFSFLLVV